MVVAEGEGTLIALPALGVLGLSILDSVLDDDVWRDGGDVHLVALVTTDLGSLEHLRGEVSCDLGDTDGATCLLEGDAQALRLYGSEADDTLVADGRQAIGGRYGLEDTGARLRLDAEALDTLPEGDVLLQDEGIEARGREKR